MIEKGTPVETRSTVPDTNQETTLKAALERARYAAPTTRACSDAAHSLVDHVVSLLPDEPQRTRGAYTHQASSGGVGWRGSRVI
jgi:hypothetical protein